MDRVLQDEDRNLEGEAQINRIEINKSAAVASKAQKDLDIAKYEAEKLSSVVTELQRRLDRLEHVGSDGTQRPTPLDSVSDESWGLAPGLGRPRGRCEAPQSGHVPSRRGSARRSDPMPTRHSRGDEWDKWLIAEYGRH